MQIQKCIKRFGFEYLYKYKGVHFVELLHVMNKLLNQHFWSAIEVMNSYGFCFNLHEL